MVAGQGFEPWILYSRSKNPSKLDHPAFLPFESINDLVKKIMKDNSN